VEIAEVLPVRFDQNMLAGEWREQVRRCEERDIALDRDIAFALAVADLLELPDNLPLMPAVTAAITIPMCLRDPASLARLKVVAREAGHRHQSACLIGMRASYIS
jgi:hypothetical protein